MKPILTLLIAIFANFAHAQTIVSTKMTGTGCPTGTASALLSPDFQSLSILFDELLAESENGVLTRKNCLIEFTLVPQKNQQIQFVKADYRGFEVLTDAARSNFKSTISAEWIFKTPRGSRRGTAMRPVEFSHWNEGPFDGPVFLTQTSQFPSWTPCGQVIYVKANIEIDVKSPGEMSLVGVDSADMTVGPQGISLGYNARGCKP